jgi:hypothetical protein
VEVNREASKPGPIPQKEDGPTSGIGAHRKKKPKRTKRTLDCVFSFSRDAIHQFTAGTRGGDHYEGNVCIFQQSASDSNANLIATDWSPLCAK